MFGLDLRGEGAGEGAQRRGINIKQNLEGIINIYVPQSILGKATPFHVIGVS